MCLKSHMGSLDGTKTYSMVNFLTCRPLDQNRSIGICSYVVKDSDSPRHERLKKK